MTQTHRGGFGKRRGATHIPLIFGSMLLPAFLVGVPQTARAGQTWYLKVGAESQDEANQADAFLPNEIWIYAGDSIEWTWQPKNEVHTVTFLQPGQTRPTPPPPIGPAMPPPPFYFGIQLSARALTPTTAAQPPTTGAPVFPALH